MAEILIVDDHTGIRMLLQEILTHEGYAVRTATTGQEALDELVKRKCDLMMLDNQLPVFNGIEVLEKMDHLDISVPTIFMTGLSDGLHEIDWIHEKTEEIVEKPFNLPDICNLIKEILNNKTN